MAWKVAERGVEILLTVALAYVAQIVAGRTEQGRTAPEASLTRLAGALTVWNFNPSRTAGNAGWSVWPKLGRSNPGPQTELD